MILTTARMRKRKEIAVTVTTGDTVSDTSKVERLLGGLVHQDMKWSEMILGNTKSLIKSLQTRTNAIAIICRIAPFKVRKMVAEGIWMSKLCYLIAVWGGTEEYLLGALQVMQNRVARYICNRGERYSGRKALAEVGWLPVRELVKYHSLLQAKKNMEMGAPSYLHHKLAGECRERLRYVTRQTVGET